MSARQPTYYDVLGVPSTAKPEEIKRRYRELARRYHPDVAKTDDAAARFREINEANSVLSDADKRANYDANLKLADLKNQKTSPSSQAPPPNSSAKPGPSPRASAEPGSTARQGSAPPNRSRGAEVESILKEAQRAMSRLKYREAEALCRRANKLARTSLGYEILGDVYRSWGRADDAVAMYSYSLQLDRTNRNVQMKFDRLVGRPSSATMAGNAARSAQAARPWPKVHSQARSAPFAAKPAQIVATILGLGMIAVLVFSATRIGSPATSPWFFDWDIAYQFALAGTGGMLGFLIALNGLLAPVGGELFAPGSRGRFGAAMGPLILGFALINFYAAFVVYLVTGFLSDRLSISMLTAFAICFAATLFFALSNGAATTFTLISAGNLIFLAFVFGWAAGGSLASAIRN